MARPDGSYDYTAEGDKGQYIYVSPQKNLVIVRNGIEYGIPSENWLKLSTILPASNDRQFYFPV